MVPESEILAVSEDICTLAAGIGLSLQKILYALFPFSFVDVPAAMFNFCQDTHAALPTGSQ